MSSRAPLATRRSPLLAALLLAWLPACGAGDGEAGSATTATTSAATATAAAAPTTAATPTTSLAQLLSAGAEPVEYPGQPAGVGWPTREWPIGPVPEGVDGAALEALLDRAFGELSDEVAYTNAIVVVQGGRIVAERYRDGVTPSTPLLSASMAKSMVQAAVGILVRDGRIDVFAPADVPQWSSPDDPRHAITVDDLLRMRSGLEWKENYVDSAADVLEMIAGSGSRDMAAYAAEKPLAHDPATVWAYNTGGINIVSGVVAREVGPGEPYREFLADELFGPLGMLPVETPIDEAGTWNGGAFANTTARSYAKFGLLYLRGGVWEGEQLLPEGWVDYARAPAPGAEHYGAGWWIGTRPGSFMARGYLGQSISVVPDLDLVVVVLSRRLDQKDREVAAGIVDLFAPLAGEQAGAGS